MDAHRKSVVLLKNDGVLPLTEEKLAGKKVYAEAFGKDKESAKEATDALREALPAEILTGDPAEADYAILMVSPSSGAYFSATPGFLNWISATAKWYMMWMTRDVRRQRPIVRLRWQMREGSPRSRRRYTAMRAR